MFDPSYPIWQRRWFQVLLGALLVLVVGSFLLPPVLWVIYATRSVLLPVLVALVLAYAVEPWVRWLEQKAWIPRPVSAVGLIAGLLTLIAGLVLYLGPQIVRQVQDLGGWFRVRFPAKMSQLVEWSSFKMDWLSQRLDTFLRRAPEPEAVTQPAAQPTGATTQAVADASSSAADSASSASSGSTLQGMAEGVDLRSITTAVLSWLDVGYEVIASTIGFAAYLTVAVAIIGFCFYFFVCKFPRIQSWFVPFIPLSHREHTLRVLGMMDQSVSAFIRGRLVQALVIGVVLSVGWWIVGVPYYLLLGIAGGLLNLIPYAAVIVWPLAILMTGTQSFAVDQPAFGLGFWWVFFWPTVIYMLAQGLDGWVVEPLVQGKATNLEPVTVLLAVLIGGSLAGLLGMLIAIPAAACLRILAQEVLLPKARQWANEA
jgi:predicted PurR-regulated permease PerM